MTLDHGELNIAGRLKNLDRDIDRELARQHRDERREARAARQERYAARKAERAAEKDRIKPTADDLADAVAVRDRFGWHRVIRVSAKSVTVATAFSWTERIPLDRVLEHRTSSTPVEAPTEGERTPMNASYTVKPLSDTTTFGQRERTPDRFDSTWSATRQLLEREIEMLQHGNTRSFYAKYVLELDVVPSQLTKEGRVRSGSKPASPAVRVVFETKKHGTLSYPCDTFTKWESNVRAVAKSLEALRLVDRYGVAAGQYVGAAQLPAGSGAGASHMTQDEARRLLLSVAYPGNPDPVSPDWPAALRRAKGLSHPDRRGDRIVWDQVEQAATVLGLS